MATLRLTFYQNNSQFVSVTGLQDQATTPSTYVNSATLTGTLQDLSGVPVAGATDIVGSYVGGSNGDYTFSIDGSDFNPPAGGYLFIIDGTYASGAKRYHAEISASVKVRNQGTET